MSSENPSFTFVRSNPDNIHLLVPLFNRVFRQNIDAEHFIRKYSSPLVTDGQFFSFMALNDKGECVAHQAAVPSLFECGNQKLWGGQSCDSVTAPEVRGKGLFSKVGRMVDEALETEGADFIVGFANEFSGKATEKGLGFKPLNGIVGYKTRIATLPLEKICRKIRFLNQAYLRMVTRTLRKQATQRLIPNSCTNPQNLTMVHDEAFFKQKPKVLRIELEGVGLWLKVHGALHIGDMEVGSPENAARALRKLKRLCFFLGINEIIIQCSPDTPLDHFMDGKAKPFESWMVMGKSFRERIDLSSLKLVYGDVDTF